MSYSEEDAEKISASIKSPDEEPKPEKLKLTEDQELILKGIRPKDMEYWQYKLLRKVLNQHIKKYLKGRV